MRVLGGKRKTSVTFEHAHTYIHIDTHIQRDIHRQTNTDTHAQTPLKGKAYVKKESKGVNRNKSCGIIASERFYKKRNARSK